MKREKLASGSSVKRQTSGRIIVPDAYYHSALLLRMEMLRSPYTGFIRLIGGFLHFASLQWLQ